MCTFLSTHRTIKAGNYFSKLLHRLLVDSATRDYIYPHKKMHSGSMRDLSWDSNALRGGSMAILRCFFKGLQDENNCKPFWCNYSHMQNIFVKPCRCTRYVYDLVKALFVGVINLCRIFSYICGKRCVHQYFNNTLCYISKPTIWLRMCSFCPWLAFIVCLIFPYMWAIPVLS